MSTTKFENFRVQSWKPSMANTIFITFQSNQLLLWLHVLSLMDSLQTIQETDVNPTQDDFQSHFMEKPCLSFGKKKQV